MITSRRKARARKPAAARRPAWEERPVVVVGRGGLGRRLGALEGRLAPAAPADPPDWPLDDQLAAVADTLDFYACFHSGEPLRYSATDRELHLLGLLCAMLELGEGGGEYAFPSGLAARLVPNGGRVLADGTNLGPTKMAEATDDPKVTYERLAWAADWHVREETYQRAIAEVVNTHYRLPFSSHWGEGRTSSSHDQVFFAGGPKDALSQPNAKYGRDRGVAFYTHVSDRYLPFYSRVINTTVRYATHVLDGLLYHESELDIAEHHTDTEGFTDQVFGSTHLLGYRFAPRIRNMKKTKLFTMRKPSRYPSLATLIGGRVNIKDIS